MTRQTSGQIDEQAAAWAARLDRGGLDASEQQALDAWTAGDPRRLGALARALALLAPVATPPIGKTRAEPAAAPPGRRRGR